MEQPGKIIVGRKRSMLYDPPTKTGRYCVCHDGDIFGHAYYTANEGDTHYPVGWAQIPHFRPSSWLDMEFDKPDHSRMDSPVKLKPTKTIDKTNQKHWFKQWISETSNKLIVSYGMLLVFVMFMVAK